MKSLHSSNAPVSFRSHTTSTVVCKAKQQTSFAFERKQGKISITVLDNTVTLPEENAWQLAIPAVGVAAVVSMMGGCCFTACDHLVAHPHQLSLILRVTYAYQD